MELGTLKDEAEREAANAAECIAGLAAALRGQVAAAQNADEALNRAQSSHRADVLALRDNVETLQRVCE